MAKKQSTRANASARVVSAPPKGAMRVTVRVRRTGRTMRVSIDEARVLVAIRVAEYIDTTPAAAPTPKPAPTYLRRDMVVAVQPAANPISLPVVSSPPATITKDDGEA